MKKFFAVIYILPMLLITGCTSNTSHTEDKIPVLEIEKAFNSEKGAILSNYANNIDYVPLETNKESLMSSTVLSDLHPLKERIYIFTSSNKDVLCFDYNGKHIPFKLHKGRAENELTYPQNMIADEKNVIINDGYNLKVFDHQGNFIRKYVDLNKPEYLRYIYIHKTEEGNVIAQNLILNYSASEVEKFKSRSGSSSKFSGKEAYMGSRIPPRIKPAGGKAYLIITNNDTLWTISEKNAELIPVYIANTGEYRNVGKRPVEYNDVIGQTDNLLVVKLLFSPVSYPNIDKKYIQSCFVHDKV